MYDVVYKLLQYNVIIIIVHQKWSGKHNIIFMAYMYMYANLLIEHGVMVVKLGMART